METQTTFDPVSRRAVNLSGTPVSAVYQGRAYYFESRENRDTFETNPDKYLGGSPVAGGLIGAQAAQTDQTDRPHRRRAGC